MALNNNIFTIEDTNSETTSALFSQLGRLLGVGKRSDGRYYLADLCTAGSINRFARFKPERNITSGPLTEAQRKANNYGFSTPPTIYVSADGITHGVYEYLKPRGKAVSPIEWNRLKDFDGYNHDAVSPLLLTFPIKMYNDSSNGIYVQPNPTNSYNEQDCVTLHDIIPNNAKDAYIALLVSCRGYIWLMPSGIKVKDATESHFPVIAFGESSTMVGASTQGNIFPYIIDELFDLEGEDLEVAVVAANEPYQTSKVPIKTNQDVYSLELSYGADRMTYKLQAFENLAGLTGGLRKINWGSAVETSGPDSSWKYHYINDLSAELFIKTPTEWHRKSVYIEAEIYNQYGYFINNLNEQVVPVLGVQIPNPASIGPMPSNTEYTYSGLLEGIVNYKAVSVENVSAVNGPSLRIVIKAYRSDGLKDKESITLYEGTHNY